MASTVLRKQIILSCYVTAIIPPRFFFVRSWQRPRFIRKITIWSVLVAGVLAVDQSFQLFLTEEDIFKGPPQTREIVVDNYLVVEGKNVYVDPNKMGLLVIKIRRI